MPKVVPTITARKKPAAKKAAVRPAKVAAFPVRLGRDAVYSPPTLKNLSAEHKELIRQLKAKRTALAKTAPYLTAEQLHPFKIKPARTIELARAAGIIGKSGKLTKTYR